MSVSLAIPNTFDFAQYFSQVDFLGNPVTCQLYKSLICYWEGKFVAPYIGSHPNTCITYDGYNYGDKKLRTWTAPSKESLHLGLIASALSGNQFAQLTLLSHKMNNISQMDDKIILDNAVQTCVDMLEKKLIEYKRFDATYPACGGFLPWVEVDVNGQMVPAREKDGTISLPALDNGQYVWSTIACLQALKKVPNVNQNVLEICTNVVNRMIHSVQTIFVSNDRVRERSLVLSDTAPIEPKNYKTATYLYESTEKESILSDPYEGELMIMFLDMCGTWTKSTNICDLYWNDIKRYTSEFIARFPIDKENKITVERGSFFSSHEQWKVIVLPYLQYEKYKLLYTNNEIARTHHSKNWEYRGLFATANVFNDEKEVVLPFGIDSLSHRDHSKTMVEHALKDMIFSAPYASFPLFMVDEPKALAWYNSMARVHGMQTEFGILESYRVKDERVHTTMTWDGKITTVLALCGGTCEILLEWMKENDKFDLFMRRVKARYDAFTVATFTDAIIEYPDERDSTTRKIQEIPVNQGMEYAKSIFKIYLGHQNQYFKVIPNKLLSSTKCVTNRSEATLFDLIYVGIDVVYIRVHGSSWIVSVLGDGRITLRDKVCGWNELFMIKISEQGCVLQSRLGYLCFPKCRETETICTISSEN